MSESDGVDTMSDTKVLMQALECARVGATREAIEIVIHYLESKISDPLPPASEQTISDAKREQISKAVDKVWGPASEAGEGSDTKRRVVDLITAKEFNQLLSLIRDTDDTSMRHSRIHDIRGHYDEALFELARLSEELRSAKHELDSMDLLMNRNCELHEQRDAALQQLAEREKEIEWLKKEYARTTDSPFWITESEFSALAESIGMTVVNSPSAVFERVASELAQLRTQTAAAQEKIERLINGAECKFCGKTIVDKGTCGECEPCILEQSVQHTAAKLSYEIVERENQQLRTQLAEREQEITHLTSRIKSVETSIWDEASKFAEKLGRPLTKANWSFLCGAIADDEPALAIMQEQDKLIQQLRTQLAEARRGREEPPEFNDGFGTICVDPGHKYWVRSLDGGEPIKITFVKREGEYYPGNVGHYGGTIMQRLLEVIDDRLGYVNEQIPCWESELARQLVRGAKAILECRAARTHGRFLEASDLSELLSQPICNQCGHIGCTRHAKPQPAQPAAEPAAVQGSLIKPETLQRAAEATKAMVENAAKGTSFEQPAAVQ